ncbi:MAG TPA: hypothetical protein VER55_13080, partial [Ardenticatenaceae bacterium]|nr:hypothetical protein [Ardenticatenaceae bacterium]
MRTTDDLILDLLSTGRRATHVEVAEIVAHVGQAPFATRLSHVPTSVRKQLHEAGVNLPAGKIRAIDWHLLKRVYLDEQWPGGTTEAEFVADLHQAVSHTQVH